MPKNRVATQGIAGSTFDPTAGVSWLRLGKIARSYKRRHRLLSDCSQVGCEEKSDDINKKRRMSRFGEQSCNATPLYFGAAGVNSAR